jgi:hypothetical protein
VATRRPPRHPSPARPSLANVAAADRRPRRLVRPISFVAAAAVAVTGALVTLAVAPATAERPTQERVQVGKNWQQPVQNAQPNDKAVAPADRGRQRTPAQRLTQVRPQPSTVPSAAPSGRGVAPASSRSGK